MGKKEQSRQHGTGKGQIKEIMKELVPASESAKPIVSDMFSASALSWRASCGLLRVRQFNDPPH